MGRVGSRLKLLAMRLYFSRYFPRGVRERQLDWHIARAARNVLSHRNPPQTFNDKVRYKMLHDRRPLLTTFADKFAVRDYVESKVGGDVLTELLLVTQDPNAVRRATLPREFALKATHGCAGSVLVADRFDQAELPEPPAGWISAAVPPQSLDWGRLRALCGEWLGRRYRPRVEWAYRHVPPRILVEELLVGDAAVPTDYKFFVFHGRVRLVQVDVDRLTNHQRNFYSRDWEVVPVQASHPRGPEVARPPVLAEMISIADKLGEETDFVRVDLYSLGDRVVFGELTSYPRAGTTDYTPESFDFELGSWWSLPADYSSALPVGEAGR